MFFGDFGLRDTFQEGIAPKSIKIDMVKLHIKFSALNVYFDDLSLDFLRSTGKPAHECIKERYPRKSRYFTVVGLSFVKTVADRRGHVASSQQALVTSFLVVSTSMTLNDPELTE